jgi:hypothetical protein
MDKRLLRALLAVMNADSNKPENTEWYAEIVKISDFAAGRGIVSRVQFWLLSDLYVIVDGVEGLISQ